jgi:hypothetical protein
MKPFVVIVSMLSVNNGIRIISLAIRVIRRFPMAHSSNATVNPIVKLITIKRQVHCAQVVPNQSPEDVSMQYQR